SSQARTRSDTRAITRFRPTTHRLILGSRRRWRCVWDGNWDGISALRFDLLRCAGLASPHGGARVRLEQPSWPASRTDMLLPAGAPRVMGGCGGDGFKHPAPPPPPAAARLNVADPGARVAVTPEPGGKMPYLICGPPPWRPAQNEIACCNVPKDVSVADE